MKLSPACTDVGNRDSSENESGPWGEKKVLKLD